MASMRLPALGKPAVLRVTRGAIEQLDDHALRWLVAHELGHLTDEGGVRRMRRSGRVLLPITFLVVILVGLLPPPLALPLVCSMSAVNVVTLARRRRAIEVAADRVAHRLCAADPDAARRALTAARVTNGMRIGWLFRLTQALGGYPPYEQRVSNYALTA